MYVVLALLIPRQIFHLNWGVDEIQTPYVMYVIPCQIFHLNWVNKQIYLVCREAKGTVSLRIHNFCDDQTKTYMIFIGRLGSKWENKIVVTKDRKYRCWITEKICSCAEHSSIVREYSEIYWMAQILLEGMENKAPSWKRQWPECWIIYREVFLQ